MTERRLYFKYLYLDVLFILLGLLLSALVLCPIHFYNLPFPFWKQNVINIVCFVLFIRLLFFIKSSIIQQFQIAKVVCILVFVFLVFFFIKSLNRFTQVIDESPLEESFLHLPFKQQLFMADYFKHEYLFFATACVILCAIMPIHLLINIWKTYNRPESI